MQRSVGALRKVGTNRPPDPWWDFPHLSVIVNDTDDEATVKAKQEKVVAEHVASHPEDAGRTIEDFFWIMRIIIRSWPMPGTQEWRDAWEAGRHPAQLELLRSEGSGVPSDTDG